MVLVIDIHNVHDVLDTIDVHDFFNVLDMLDVFTKSQGSIKSKS